MRMFCETLSVFLFISTVFTVCLAGAGLYLCYSLSLFSLCLFRSVFPSLIFAQIPAIKLGRLDLCTVNIWRTLLSVSTFSSFAPLIAFLIPFTLRSVMFSTYSSHSVFSFFIFVFFFLIFFISSLLSLLLFLFIVVVPSSRRYSSYVVFCLIFIFSRFN